MNIHKNSFENVNFFCSVSKTTITILNKKNKYFKDYGRDIHSKNLKHILIDVIITNSYIGQSLYVFRK